MNGMWKEPVDGVLQFKAGTLPTFEITSDKDAYFGVWAVNEDHSVMQIFPNKYESDNHLDAGKTRTLGAPGKGWDFEPTAAHGTEYIRVLASTKQIESPLPRRKRRRLRQYPKAKSQEFVSVLRGMGGRKTPEQVTGEVLVPFHVSPK